VPHIEQAWVRYASAISKNVPPFLMDLYESIVLKSAHPASSELLPIRVLAIFEGLTSPTMISPFSRAIFALAWCRKSGATGISVGKGSLIA
jgi:hypothetical protein